ncbi:hypothetical protein GN244_ATG17711 [Phytophthora infestans]|uniref:Uncharacterized protein n=1 Tax=Phytophthora infestans TaxID=4787 RepID=A0A833WE83_PHYIN|nr:hypothetical protein GN244_ATG17711 [Phytophthora infestans]
MDTTETKPGEARPKRRTTVFVRIGHDGDQTVRIVDVLSVSGVPVTKVLSVHAVAKLALNAALPYLSAMDTTETKPGEVRPKRSTTVFVRNGHDGDQTVRSLDVPNTVGVRRARDQGASNACSGEARPKRCTTVFVRNGHDGDQTVRIVDVPNTVGVRRARDQGASNACSGEVRPKRRTTVFVRNGHDGDQAVRIVEALNTVRVRRTRDQGAFSACSGLVRPIRCTTVFVRNGHDGDQTVRIVDAPNTVGVRRTRDQGAFNACSGEARPKRRTTVFVRIGHDGDQTVRIVDVLSVSGVPVTKVLSVHAVAKLALNAALPYLSAMDTTRTKPGEVRPKRRTTVFDRNGHDGDQTVRSVDVPNTVGVRRTRDQGASNACSGEARPKRRTTVFVRIGHDGDQTVRIVDVLSVSGVPVTKVLSVHAVAKLALNAALPYLSAMDTTETKPYEV